jgi:hypothetical protein
VIHLFLKTARKVDEAANFVFMQLNEQQSGIYAKRQPDCATKGKTDLAWERISHETSLDPGYFETI